MKPPSIAREGSGGSTLRAEIEAIYRDESRQAFATLIRLLNDFDLAEEALQDAYVAALTSWETEGIPAQPRAWLISTARFKAIDTLRRKTKLSQLQPQLLHRLQEIEAANERFSSHEVQDDQLRLIFTCCHPAIDPQIQVPLTLREVCGLTTDEIARAFMISPTTMAQRIVRGKAKIRDAKIPFAVPSLRELPERLDAVLSVIYLVFNEGYSASSGDSLTRVDLSEEAIRLARLVHALIRDSEVAGLLALMLLHESRREARVDAQGDIVLLEDQDRSLWRRELIDEGRQLIEESFASRSIGVYVVQAAISAVHAEASDATHTDWPQIVALYDILLRIAPSPIVELNRAVAVAKRDGAQAGLTLIDTIIGRGDLSDYHLAHAARAHLLLQLGRSEEARTAFGVALRLAKQEPERRFLQKKISQLSA